MIQVRCQGPSPRCPRSKWCSDMMFLPDLIAFLPHSPNFPEGLSGHKHVDSEIDSFCELHRSKWPYWVSACTEFCSISTLNFESRRNAQLLSTLLSLNHLLFPVRLPFNFVQFLPAPQPVVFLGGETSPGEISLREFIDGLLKLRTEMIVLETLAKWRVEVWLIFPGLSNEIF